MRLTKPLDCQNWNSIIVYDSWSFNMDVGVTRIVTDTTVLPAHPAFHPQSE